jgi:hypothetical protein
LQAPQQVKNGPDLGAQLLKQLWHEYFYNLKAAKILV